MEDFDLKDVLQKVCQIRESIGLYKDIDTKTTQGKVEAMAVIGMTPDQIAAQLGLDYEDIDVGGVYCDAYAKGRSGLVLLGGAAVASAAAKGQLKASALLLSARGGWGQSLELKVSQGSGDLSQLSREELLKRRGEIAMASQRLQRIAKRSDVVDVVDESDRN